LILFLILNVSSALFAQQHGTVIPADSVWYVDPVQLATGNSAPKYFNYGDTVTIVGVITFNPKLYAMSSSKSRVALWMQDTSMKPYSGTNVFVDPAVVGSSLSRDQFIDITKFYDNCIPGRTIKFTGQVSNYSQNQQLTLIDVETEIVNLTPTPIKPIVTSIDQFMKDDGTGTMKQQYLTGEPYESMLVRFNNVTVVDVVSSGGTRFYWSVMDDDGNKIKIRDNSGFFRNDGYEDADLGSYTFTPPGIGTRLDYIQGHITEYANEYYLSPGDTSDLAVAAKAPKIENIARDILVPKSTETVHITAEVTHEETTIDSVFLYFAVGTHGSYISQIMSKNGNTYSGSIPAQANRAFVKYYVRAVDANRNSVEYPNPTTPEIYRVLDNGIQSIIDIQETYSGGGLSVWNGDTLRNIQVGGIITASVDQLGFAVMQSGTLPFSGIFLKSAGEQGIADLQVGDSIVINSCRVYEDYSVTMLDYIGGNKHSVISQNNPLAPTIKNLNPDSIASLAYNHTELYEGMLVEFNNIYYLGNPDGAGDYGEWFMNYDSTATQGIRADDKSQYIGYTFRDDKLVLGQKLSFIKGILWFSFYNYKMLPRDRYDLPLPIVNFSANPITGEKPLQVQFSDESENNPLIWEWFMPGADTEYSLSQNPTVTYDSIGTFTVSLKVSNDDGSDSLAKINYIHVTNGIGISDIEGFGLFSVYPNPAQNKVIVVLQNGRLDDVSLEIIDITGKTLFHTMQRKDSPYWSEEIDITHMQKGVYIIKLQMNEHMVFSKLIVN
jgi:PKD repeat protein